MMIAGVSAGVSLFALLIVDICCVPLQKGAKYDLYGGGYTNMAPNSNHKANTGHFSGGAVLPINAASYDGALLDNQAGSGLTVSQPIAHGGSTPSVGSSSSRPVRSGSRSARAGVSFQPGSGDFSGAVARSSFPSASEEKSSGFHGLVSSQSESISSTLPSGPMYWGVELPHEHNFKQGDSGTERETVEQGLSTEIDAFPSVGPMYRGGELSHYELSFEHGDSETETEEQGLKTGANHPVHPMYRGGELVHYERSFEHGNSQRETEEQGSPVPRPLPFNHISEGPAFTSQPYPDFIGWGLYPHDFMFLNGRYPPGTVTYSSSSYEQGTDHWEDSRYIKDHNTITDFTAPWSQSFQDPQTHVMAYGQSGAQAGLPASHGTFTQPVKVLHKRVSPTEQFSKM